MRQTRASRDRVQQLCAALGPPPWSLTEVRDHGWSEAAIRAAVAAGRLVRPRRGVVSLPGAAEADPLHDIRAALLVCGPDAVVSHDSAVLWHGLWQPRRMSHLVHLTVPDEAGRTDNGLRIHRSSLPAHLVSSRHGWPVTTMARTAADAVRGRGIADGVVIMDSAARRILAEDHGLDTFALRDEAGRERRRDVALRALREAADSVAGWTGSRVLRRVLDAVEPASESPFESWSRVWILGSSLPAPRIAYAVQGASGRWYFSDFAWVGARVLGEADGIGTYGTDPVAVARALRAERVRQRDLEDAGWRFVRWDSSERPRAVLSRLRSALAGHL
jgi:hypothetical protein